MDEERKTGRIKVLSIKEMGVQTGSYRIFLFRSFLSTQLGIVSLQKDKGKREEIADIQCPFCKKGVLILKKIRPRYSYFQNKKRKKERIHIANEYRYECSNLDCKGKFFGIYVDI